ncbi:MAG: 2-phospho-L-lactate guanylyltransferase [Actinomycetota bacterium]|nr:2-phospho-L-lactate guanylyltransferase [Actinomycetota bacterium]
MDVAAVVPVKDLLGTKSRLAPVLDPAGRAGLTIYMMCRVISALQEAKVQDICVVSPDPLVLQKAGEKGVSTLLQDGVGLNPALEEGRRWAMVRGASALLVLPADLPLLDAGDIRSVVAGCGESPSGVISPDAARSGTNALMLRPPDAIPFAFGIGSFEAHQREARERGVPLATIEHTHLSFDLDTGDDLARFQALEDLMP